MSDWIVALAKKCHEYEAQHMCGVGCAYKRRDLEEIIRRHAAPMMEAYRRAALEGNYTVGAIGGAAMENTYEPHKCPPEWIAPNGSCSKCACDSAEQAEARCAKLEKVVEAARQAQGCCESLVGCSYNEALREALAALDSSR